MLKPFGARIAGISRTAKPRPSWFGPGDGTFAAEDAAAAVRDAAFLLCFLPSGAGTDGIVGEKLLSALPPGAFLLNFGRGNAVDEGALAAALRGGRLAGAVLDVYREEPLPLSSPLRDAPNVWLFPHSSAFSPDYLDLWFAETAPFLRSLRRARAAKPSRSRRATDPGGGSGGNASGANHPDSSTSVPSGRSSPDA